MGKELHIIYRPLPDVSPESELNALAAVYKFLLDRHAEKHATDHSIQSHQRKEESDEPLRSGPRPSWVR